MSAFDGCANRTKVLALMSMTLCCSTTLSYEHPLARSPLPPGSQRPAVDAARGSRGTLSPGSFYPPSTRFPASANLTESISIVFEDAYFRDLSDFGGENEAIVAFSIEDLSTGKKSVSFVGPMDTPDRGRANTTGVIVYGPEAIPELGLKVRIQVLEYDQQQREDRAGVIKFLRSASSAVSLGNPVTSAETKIAESLLLAINELDEDDVIIDRTFDAFVPPTADRPSTASPLQVGLYAVLDRVKAPEASRFWPFTKKAWNWSATTRVLTPVTTVVDAALLPLQAVFVLGADIPDAGQGSKVAFNGDEWRDELGGGGAIKAIDGVLVECGAQPGWVESLVSDAPDPATCRPYERKSWVTFSVHGDRPLGQTKVNNLTLRIERLLEDARTGSTLGTQVADLERLIGQLKTAVDERDAERAGVSRLGGEDDGSLDSFELELRD